MWIEINQASKAASLSVVTPLAGVWIEIPGGYQYPPPGNVTPLAGVWIEISCGSTGNPSWDCHSPCGSVD